MYPLKNKKHKPIVMVIMGGNKKKRSLKWLKYPGNNDAIGNNDTALAKAYHFNILSMLNKEVKRYSGVSVTIMSQPMFSHTKNSPILAAIIPQ